MSEPTPDPLLKARHKATRLAARANIVDVRLFEAHAKVHRFPDAQASMQYLVQTQARAEYEPGDSSFVVRVNYDVAIADAAEGAEDAAIEGDAAVSIIFEYAALFVLAMREDDGPLTEDELDAYAASTGQFALYPFARQYVFDVTSRLGLPPLTLATLRLPVSPDELPQAAVTKAKVK